MTLIRPAALAQLSKGYQLCAATEGKSPSTVAIVSHSVNCFLSFLATHGMNTDVALVSRHEIRAFILYLQQKRRFSNHRFTHVQNQGLSGHTINCYLRSLRVFFSWLVAENVILRNPFDLVKIPKPPRKIIPTFTDCQIQQLLNTIDVRTSAGYRDHAIILTLLDTGLRVSELCSFKLSHLWLEEGMLKTLGKGNKERLIPIGKRVQRCLWHYVNRCRPEPAGPNSDLLFLTKEGRPLTKDRVEKITKSYGRKAELKGVRCSPHTLRHTAATKFLRNGGDVFSLQKMLGHASLEMTRRYCELADIDVKRAHMTASPVDGLVLHHPGDRSHPRDWEERQRIPHREGKYPRSCPSQ